MSLAKSKVRENGTSVRLYSSNNRKEVQEAMLEMEAEQAADAQELRQLLGDADQFEDDDFAA